LVARVGLLGGTFDPVHIGHLIMAESAREALGLDWVEFIPARIPPHKAGEPITQAVHRVGMLQAAIENASYFRLNLMELERTGPSFTVDTLVELRQSRPGDEFVFIIGSDSLIDLPRWREPQQILELTTLAVIDRPGNLPDLATLEQSLPAIRDSVAFVDAPHIDISSTRLRAQLSENRSVRYQTPDAVIAYIERERVYRSRNDRS
jgi:nicotinate-nucleotide adenylyltransferase